MFSLASKAQKLSIESREKYGKVKNKAMGAL